MTYKIRKICSLICILRLFIVELVQHCVHSLSLFYNNVYILLVFTRCCHNIERTTSAKI